MKSMIFFLLFTTCVFPGYCGEGIAVPQCDSIKHVSTPADNKTLCPFCNSDVLQTQTIYETEHLYVLIDHAPRVRGHLLVIPKRHVFKAHELCQEEWTELSVMVQKIVKVFSECLGTDQYVIMEKNGPRAFQEIPHVHFHLLPIHSETWGEVWNHVPKTLGDIELEQEVTAFRTYFR